MKHALALYIDSLAAYAAAQGRLPDGAASARALRPIWEALSSTMADALEQQMADEMASEIGARRAENRAALDLAGFGPVQEAVDALARKTVVPSVMRSAEWALVPTQIRNAAQFSAGIASARVMGAIQDRLMANQSWDFSVPTGREAFLRDMREVMQAEGIGRTVTGEGSLTNPQANSRLGLIFDQQTRAARGFANWKMGLDPDLLDAAPAQELYREAEPKGGPGARRDWRARWTEAGGTLYGGRMVALKTDGIWVRISRFGTPWPPFDFGSHMGVRDVTRTEAEKLGLIARDEPVRTDERAMDSSLRASADGIPEGMRSWLKASFGDRIEFDGDTARWTGARRSNRTEADDWGRRALGGVKIAQDEKNALTAYQNRETFAKVNIGLRAGIVTDEAKRISATIGRARTHEAAVVWRAEDAGYLGGVDRFVGAVLIQPSFLSTAFSRDQAEMGYAKDAQMPILYEIYVPKGVKALYLNAVTKSSNAHETELLLQRGARLYVRGLERSKLPDGREVTIVKTEVLP